MKFLHVKASTDAHIYAAIFVLKKNKNDSIFCLSFYTLLFYKNVVIYLGGCFIFVHA